MEKNPYFKDQYDVIIIGGAMSGLAAALDLNNKKVQNILVLEKNNTPGGVTTSFVRNGFEFEVALHEMASVSSEAHPLSMRRWFEGNNIHINWLRVDDAFTYSEPGFTITVKAGEGGKYDVPSHIIADAVGDPDGSLYKKLMAYFNDCRNVYLSIAALGNGPLVMISNLNNHVDMLRSVGYTTGEVLDVYQFPPLVKRILSAYWSYLGNSPEKLPYILYSYIVADYVGYGPYIAKETGNEISVRMMEECRKRGIQVELGQEVDKILVRHNHVQGVRLKDGTVIHSNYVIAGTYPNTVYTKMVEPLSAVPKRAYKIANSRELSASAFSVMLMLDKSYEELGISEYMTFVAPEGLDFDKILPSLKGHEDYLYYMATCSNIVNPEATRKGTCSYTITALPYPDSFMDVTEENYQEIKHALADKLIQRESRRLGIDLKDHILEIEIITPVSIAHHSKTFRGCIYGYLSTQDDNIVARILTHGDELLIPGLSFCGASQFSGDGMAPALSNGNQGCEDTLTWMSKDKKRKQKYAGDYLVDLDDVREKREAGKKKSRKKK